MDLFNQALNPIIDLITLHIISALLKYIIVCIYSTNTYILGHICYFSLQKLSYTIKSYCYSVKNIHQAMLITSLRVGGCQSIAELNYRDNHSCSYSHL